MLSIIFHCHIFFILTLIQIIGIKFMRQLQSILFRIHFVLIVLFLFLFLLNSNWFKLKLLIFHKRPQLLLDPFLLVSELILILQIILKRRRNKPRQFTTLPIMQNLLCHCIIIRLSALQQSAVFVGNLRQKIIGIRPLFEFVHFLQILLAYSLQNLSNVLLRIFDRLHTNHRAEDGRDDVVARSRIHSSWTVDEVELIEQRHVLPHFGLSWNGRHRARFLANQTVDH
mmetsp:Transcript_48821/g.78020  ORF Transcript_48821/g.78020 Transcript_48821/m.78020 type:complete len:227 (-) Transcript_48821:211-891(-)